MCIILISQFLFVILFVIYIMIAPLRWFMPLCIPAHSFAWHPGRFDPPKELNLILIQTPQTLTAVVKEGGRKNKWMSESEWAGERVIEKRAAPSSSLTLTLPAIIEKKFQKSTALEFRLHPPHTAADSHTHAYLHIYSPVNGPSLTHLSLVIHLLLRTPPAFTALHFTPNHSPPGWRDTPQCVFVCVCCAVTCSHHWGSDTRNTRCHFGQSQTLAGLSFSLKHPHLRPCVCECLCLSAWVSWIQIEPPSSAIVSETDAAWL